MSPERWGGVQTFEEEGEICYHLSICAVVAGTTRPLAAEGETGGRDALSQLQGGGARASGLLVERERERERVCL